MQRRTLKRSLQKRSIAKDDQANSGDPAEYGKMLEAARLHKATMAVRQDTSLTEQERDAEAQGLLNAASKIVFLSKLVCP